jgi:hypothetical protein
VLKHCRFRGFSRVAGDSRPDPLSSWLVLGERISPTRWLGIALVLIGLAIVARPVTQLEEKL